MSKNNLTDEQLAVLSRVYDFLLSLGEEKETVAPDNTLASDAGATAENITEQSAMRGEDNTDD